jgi:hypothetical protein
MPDLTKGRKAERERRNYQLGSWRLGLNDGTFDRKKE